MKLEKGDHVLITTSHRGVFAGKFVERIADDRIVLDEARCAIRFGTTGGFAQLAATGPTENSKVGAKAPQAEFLGVTAVLRCSAEAANAWDAA